LIERGGLPCGKPAQILETKSDSKNFKVLKNLDSDKTWVGKPTSYSKFAAKIIKLQ